MVVLDGCASTEPQQLCMCTVSKEMLFSDYSANHLSVKLAEGTFVTKSIMASVFAPQPVTIHNISFLTVLMIHIPLSRPSEEWCTTTVHGLLHSCAQPKQLRPACGVAWAAAHWC